MPFQDTYDSEFVVKVYQSPVVSYQELKEDKIVYDGPVRIVYHTKDAFKRNAKMLGLMDDFRVRFNFFVGFLTNCSVSVRYSRKKVYYGCVIL